MGVLRVVAHCVERLRLIATDSSSGDDPVHAVSRRYLKIQTALLKGMSLEPLFGSSVDEDRSSQHSAGQVRRFDPGSVNPHSRVVDHISSFF